jgi:hypothetical protein
MLKLSLARLAAKNACVCVQADMSMLAHELARPTQLLSGHEQALLPGVHFDFNAHFPRVQNTQVARLSAPASSRSQPCCRGCLSWSCHRETQRWAVLAQQVLILLALLVQKYKYSCRFCRLFQAGVPRAARRCAHCDDEHKGT